MKRELWMLGGLLIVSYGVLLGLTMSDHLPDATGTVAAAPAPVAEQAEPMKLTEAEPAEPQPDPIAHLAANEPLPDEGISSGESDEMESAIPPVMQSAASEGAEALLRRASSPDAAIEALSQALQPDSDRETRLAAVNALLVFGRKSTVDPAVLAMLKEAVKDSDSAVAAQANSALAEVERPTH